MVPLTVEVIEGSHRQAPSIVAWSTTVLEPAVGSAVLATCIGPPCRNHERPCDHVWDVTVTLTRAEAGSPVAHHLGDTVSRQDEHRLGGDPILILSVKGED